MRQHHFLTSGKNALFTLFFLLLFFNCTDEQLISDTALNISTDLNTSTVTNGITDCSACTYVVPAKTGLVDGKVLGLKPGSVIGLDANIAYASIYFKNIVGTYENPIIIKNCNGTARLDGTGNPYTIKTEYSEFFRITGGNVNKSYGIIVNSGVMGLALGKLSTDFQVDHIEIQNSGFAGIMAKTDPTCDDATIRGNFLMKGVALNDNYIHDTGGEGIYAGHSWFTGIETGCGVRLPHEIHYIRIHGNIVKNTGWDGIQLGCATKGATIYGNTVENYGTLNKGTQNGGIQLSAGTGGVCYNNFIKKGTGNGINVFGLGDNIVHNNVIDSAGYYGIFCDERSSTGPGFKFINNTIVNPRYDGIRIYADLLPMNVIINNIIVNPGSYPNYTYPRKPEDAFVYKLSKYVKVEMLNNYFVYETDQSALNNIIDSNYRAYGNPLVIDQGTDISPYANFRRDFYYKERFKGSTIDIGAVENL
jgi:hypothetical protein